MRVVHGLAVELSAVGVRLFATSRKAAAVSLPVIEVVVYVAVEVIAAVKPRTSADEDAAVVPFRTVIAIWSAVIRWLLVVAVGAGGRRADLHGDLRG